MVRIRVEQFMGWALSIVTGEKVPRIGHREVARRLGYGDAKEVLVLADRVFGEDWKLRVPCAEFREGTRGPMTREYLCSRHEVIRLAMRSEAPNAEAIQEEIATVYEAWLDQASSPPATDLPPWARTLLEGIGGGVQLARAEAKDAAAGAARAEEKADRATEVAEEARKVAKQAAALAGSRGVLDALADTIPPGRAAETPDAAVSRRPREGYKSMRSVAWEYALPRTSEGALLVSRIAEAIGIFDDPTLFHVQDVVIGGRVKNEHRTYSPRALELLDKPLRAAHAVMVGLGFTTTKGGAMVPLRTGTRSRAWVLKEMFDAAIAPTVAPSDPQQAMPFEKAS